MLKPIQEVDDALCFNFVFANNIAFRDLFMPECMGKYYVTRFYQYPEALSEEGVSTGGRSCGKSVSLSANVLKTVITCFDEETVFSAFRKVHVCQIMEEIIGWVSKIRYFRLFFKGRSYSPRDSVGRQPIYHVQLRNGHHCYGISIGDDPFAVMLLGRHPQYRYVDEMAVYPKSAWEKWQEAKDPSGCKDKYYGVADGRRGTPFHGLNTKVDKFKGKRFRFNRILEPHWNQEVHRDRVQVLGSEKNQLWLNEILGLWGSPVYELWDIPQIIRNFDKEVDEWNLLKNQMKMIYLDNEDYKSMTPEIALEGLPDLPEKGIEVIIGGDEGRSQPTFYLPFFRYQGKWWLTAILQLGRGFDHDEKAELAKYMMDKYNATFATDCSEGTGIAVMTALKKSGDYEEENRLIMSEAQKPLFAGYRNDGSEIKENWKSRTTQILLEFFRKEGFNIYKSEQILEEFDKESQTKRAGAALIVTPPYIHITDAFRVFAHAWHIRHELALLRRSTKPKEDYSNMAMPEKGDIGITIMGRKPGMM